MYISLILKKTNIIAICLLLQENINEPQWLREWLKEVSIDFNKSVEINDTSKIEHFIKVYEENRGKGTEFSITPILFNCINGFNIFCPAQLKGLYDEIRMRTEDLQYVSDDIFESSITEHPASKYFSFNIPPVQDNLKEVMVIAPIKNIHLLNTIKKYQASISEQLHLFKEEAESYPHISFAIPLRITNDDLKKLSKELSNIEINALEIELGNVKAFQNNTIYIEVKDKKGLLNQLNQKIVSAIKEADIPYEIRYPKYIPHISLFVMTSQLTNVFQQPAELDRNTYYLDTVILSERMIAKGNIEYKNILSIPMASFLLANSIEKNYFSNELIKLFKSLRFDENPNPVADYYRLLHKLDVMDQKKGKIWEECQHLYKKILNFNNQDRYPDDNITKALQLYACGLIFQYPDRLTGLRQKTNESMELQSALMYFNQAYKLGYWGALKNIGIIKYQLGQYTDSIIDLENASRMGETSRYTELFLNHCQKEIKQISHQKCNIL